VARGTAVRQDAPATTRGSRPDASHPIENKYWLVVPPFLCSRSVSAFQFLEVGPFCFRVSADHQDEPSHVWRGGVWTDFPMTSGEVKSLSGARVLTEEQLAELGITPE